MGLLMVLTAIAWELQRFGLISFRWRDLWPLYLVAAGCYMLWRALYPPDPARRRNEFTDKRLAEFAVFGGGDINVTTTQFEGGSVFAMFGGYEVDFTNSRIVESPAIIHADAIFGGVSFKVPPTWRVTTGGGAIFGGFDNSALPPPETGEPAQHLIVRGMALFGGVEVKN